MTTTTAAPITTTALPTTTTSAPTTTAAPTTITIAPTTHKTATTTTTASQTTITDTTTTTPVTSAATIVTPAKTTVTPATTTVSTPLLPISMTTTTTTTEVPAPTFVVEAVVIEPFVPELNNRSSQPFKVLEKKVIFMCDLIYRARFPLQFVCCYVIAFTQATPAARAAPRTLENTQAELGIEFNKTTPMVEIPKQEAVQEVLIEVANTSTIDFNITIQSDSIKITQTPIHPTAGANSSTAITATNVSITPTRITMTAPNNSSPSTFAPPHTHNPTSTAPVTVVSSMVCLCKVFTPARTTATSTVVNISKSVNLGLVDAKFTSDLLDPSSEAFRLMSAEVKSKLEPLFKKQFSSFDSLDLVSYREGAANSTINLRFMNKRVPDDRQIEQVLIRAASSITGTRSFSDTSSDAGNHKISLPTASCLLLLSWQL
ncbi:uncharacterized protein ACNS7B_021086 isoform 2-T2 [Menidia menidia]